MSTNTDVRIPLPEAFIEQMQKLLGEEETDKLCSALEGISPTSIRINQNKLTASPFEPNTPIPWCPWGYYLDERPSFTAHPPLHTGGYYVQEASSMLLALCSQYLPEYPILALDMCAAPGGKSTLLLDILTPKSVLVSNEVVRHRANILTENLQKWGNPYSIVTSAMPQGWSKLRNTFDLILVDAPCSGEGMFRKDMGARREWSPANVVQCVTRQREILDNIWDSLRPGGLLIYSTCTFNREENEDQLSYIVEKLGAKPLALELPQNSGILLSPFSPYPAYRMMPHRVNGEGIFMVIVRKEGIEEKGNSLFSTSSKSKRKGQPKPATTIPQEMKRWVSDKVSDMIEWEQLPSGEIYAYPDSIQSVVQTLRQAKLPILSAGIPLGEVKGKSLIPHPALAYNWGRNPDAFTTYELSKREALAFLAKDTLTLPQEVETGIVLVTYQGLGLGFVKHLGNRTNNLFPDAWRIRNLNLVRDSNNE